MKKNSHRLSLFLALFSSTSTLICCAIPAVLVMLGAGSAVMALVVTFPQLVWLSEHKTWVFALAGIMLGISGYSNWKNQNICPLDPILAKNCERTKAWSKWVWRISVILYGIGVVVAYIIPLIMTR